ncbi:MAG: hypothetical protein KDA73_15210 [Rhodobacteraceae bacterium]|nr:hypothetical protein [Paracoccaceae bacterium]
MRSKLFSAILAGGLTVAAGAALADNYKLTDAQMDGVSAGATAIAFGASGAVGDLLAETIDVSAAQAQAGVFAAATNSSTALAASTWFGAAAASSSTSAASLP